MPGRALSRAGPPGNFKLVITELEPASLSLPVSARCRARDPASSLVPLATSLAVPRASPGQLSRSDVSGPS
jgi:hypothetical protein